jgi:hypothetical protein
MYVFSYAAPGIGERVVSISFPKSFRHRAGTRFNERARRRNAPADGERRARAVTVLHPVNCVTLLYVNGY